MYLKRLICSRDAKPPDFGAIRPASDEPMAPHGSTNNHARRKHLTPPVGIPGLHVKNDSKQGTCTASSEAESKLLPLILGDTPNTPERSVMP